MATISYTLFGFGFLGYSIQHELIHSREISRESVKFLYAGSFFLISCAIKLEYGGEVAICIMLYFFTVLYAISNFSLAMTAYFYYYDQERIKAKS